MRAFVFFVGICSFLLCTSGESLPRYWLVEEDFIKLGKKELYEEEKKKELEEQQVFLKKKRKPFEVIGIEDLENPQYVFFMPLKELSVLDLYPPIKDTESLLLNTCLHFRIFSLHELLEECSFRGGVVFSRSHPYLSYILYDVAPGSQKFFEDHLMQICLKQSKKAPLSWNTWKVLLGADSPKYLVCAAFSTKEELKDANLESFFEELSIKEILRNKKNGWMKRAEPLSFSKKS